jgi:hypothetical protein
MVPRKPRKSKNVIVFPKKPYRLIRTKGVEVLNPYQQLSETIGILVDRDGPEPAFHMLSEFTEQLRRHLAKEMLVRSSG